MKKTEHAPLPENVIVVDFTPKPETQHQNVILKSIGILFWLAFVCVLCSHPSIKTWRKL